MNKLGFGFLAFILVAATCVFAQSGKNAASDPELNLRTRDKAFHELLKMRREIGPELMKRDSQEAPSLQRASRAFTLTQPTLNMLNYDITYYRINISLNFSDRSIASEVLISGRALIDNLSLIDLTFPAGFTIDNLQVEGQPVSYLQNGDLFTVYLPAPLDSGQLFNILVTYHGYPVFGGMSPSGIGGGLSFKHAYTSQICQTECEPFGARNWFPCKDFPFDKADSVDLFVTHPSGMTTSSNGLLQSITDHGDGTSTTHWRTNYPITTYVIHFVTAYQNLYTQHWEYAPGDTMPVVVYAYDGYGWGVQNYLTYTIPGLQIFSDLFGLYPFVKEKYGNSFYDEWGMENQTMTVLIPSLANEWTIIHEMSHHWWGNLITCRDFHHIWLNEGFGTYSEALYYEHLYGSDYYHDYVLNQDCLDAPSVYVEDLDQDYIFNPTTTYNKGSRVLHMLRRVVGDSAFFQIIRNYEADPKLQYGNAVTSDFQAHCETVYGHPLNWFFDEWIYQPGNPHYEYGYFNYYDSSRSQSKLALNIHQVQDQYPLFQMPVDIQIYMGNTDTTLVVFNSRGRETFILDVPAPVDSIKLDPNDWILCTKAKVALGLAVTSISADTGYVGEYYYLKLDAIGGTPPYFWEKTAGQFPYGLQLTCGDSCYISGYPTYASDFGFKMRVHDSSIPEKADSLWLQIAVLPFAHPKIGDVNADGKINIADPVYIINYIFQGGFAPDPYTLGDVNCDGKVNIVDVVYLINYIFKNGPPPCQG